MDKPQLRRSHAPIRSRRRSSGGGGRQNACWSDHGRQPAQESAHHRPENQPTRSDNTAPAPPDVDTDAQPRGALGAALLTVSAGAFERNCTDLTRRRRASSFFARGPGRARPAHSRGSRQARPVVTVAVTRGCPGCSHRILPGRRHRLFSLCRASLRLHANGREGTHGSSKLLVRVRSRRPLGAITESRQPLARAR